MTTPLKLSFTLGQLLGKQNFLKLSVWYVLTRSKGACIYVTNTMVLILIIEVEVLKKAGKGLR